MFGVLVRRWLVLRRTVSAMTTSSSSTASNLGIDEGNRVRLIGGTAELEVALGQLPDGVTVTPLGSETANVGVVVVEDESDLRERLFTELEGLKGANHVWVLSTTVNGAPDVEAIGKEAAVVSWEAGQTVAVGDWTAVELTFTS